MLTNNTLFVFLCPQFVWCEMFRLRERERERERER